MMRGQRPPPKYFFLEPPLSGSRALVKATKEVNAVADRSLKTIIPDELAIKKQDLQLSGAWMGTNVTRHIGHIKTSSELA